MIAYMLSIGKSIAGGLTVKNIARIYCRRGGPFLVSRFAPIFRSFGVCGPSCHEAFARALIEGDTELEAY